MNEHVDVAIIGAGPAGAAVVEGLREGGSRASAALFGSADQPPVYRPDLSKALWLEEGRSLTDSYLLTPDPRTSLRLGETVTAIDPAAHTITLATGDEVSYDAAVLATGSAPLRLGAELGARVLTYREAEDFQALRAAASEGSHAVIIGGGYIGAELASALRQNDVAVTMVMPERYVQERMFPPALAARITAGFTARGVEIVHGGFAAARTSATEVTAILADGTEISADVVVLGVGVEPRTDLAAAAGLEVAPSEAGGGVVVDEYLRTSVADVYAVGDVARYPDRLLGPRRVEHIDNAQAMGTALGRILAGGNEPYEHTPFFWSDLFEDGYEAIGELDSRLETFIDESAGGGAAVVYYLGSGERAGQVRGVLLWNTWDSVPAAQEVIRETQAAPVADPTDLRGRIPPG